MATMRCLIALVALCSVGAAPVQEAVELQSDGEPGRMLQDAAAPPPPKKAAFSLWGAAKSFFTSREKIKARVSGAPPSPTKLVMPAKYGVSYKAMVTWYCTQPENKLKSLCKLNAAGKVTDASVALDISKPTTNDSKDAFKAFCIDKEHKKTVICMTSAIKSSTAAKGAKVAPKPRSAPKPAA